MAVINKKDITSITSKSNKYSRAYSQKDIDQIIDLQNTKIEHINLALVGIVVVMFITFISLSITVTLSFKDSYDSYHNDVELLKYQLLNKENSR